MAESEQIREHMEVVGSDGGHVGTVDRMELGHIRLTRRDDPDGSGAHHHHIPLSAIDRVEAGQVRLTMPAQQARAMAVGGLRPQDVQDGVPSDDEPGENAGGAQSSAMEDQAGTGTIHGGGTTGPGSLPGWGTGQRTAGPGFPDDPNMDRHGGSDPTR
ncbi:DUF2171 domain-containing protein [Siccirubricoccus sp. KC 17139]|uniref:DUF2171 domain-containing protein n=1 Tax=Siccirubricoccus soli TaxID=2899147 RepID=A0ABT1D391_9PROT|nr:DUF2171 domain-containing protein [Siccirubricoccus soli]MCO6416386.1 DUF2171 domain-containing protein [Siccirubricoccus soli]MCP2682520.1 DUF2171 domain-containing protein [Siccirubricoccus soli]